MNELLAPEVVNRLRGILTTAAPGLPWNALQRVADRVDGLALRARTDLIAAALVEDLSSDDDTTGYQTAATTFRRALGEPSFSGWMLWPVTEAAVTLALDDNTFGDIATATAITPAAEDCLALLSELTPRLTSEFAIRRILATDLDGALAIVRGWTSHDNEHVRRLASEGTRAYLPWAIRVPALVARPEATIPILAALYADPSDYVRRSVANHLNDIARHDPELVVETAAAWIDAATAQGDSERLARTRWVVKHGLRTLVKKAHPGALGILGFEPVTVSVSAPTISTPVVTLPGSLAFEFSVVNTGDTAAKLAVDFVVHYRKANGTLADKVFKLAAVTLEPGESKSFSKSHGFRQMTTRVHYAGEHALELQVNGVRSGLSSFVVAL